MRVEQIFQKRRESDACQFRIDDARARARGFAKNVRHEGGKRRGGGNGDVPRSRRTHRMPPGTVVLCTKHVKMRSLNAVKLWRCSRFATRGSVDASCSCAGERGRL